MPLDAVAEGQPQLSRLRNACNECHAAKVKCSGERSGCQRCQRSGLQCVYVESRAGKVQGPRTKKRQQEYDPEEPRSRPQSISTRHSSVSTSTPAVPSIVSTDLDSQGHEQYEGDFTWESDWQVDALIYAGGTDASGDSSTSQVATTIGTNSSPPASASTIVVSSGEGEYQGYHQLDPNFDELLLTMSSDSTSNHSPLQPTHFTQSLGLHPRNETDSQCCLDCCQMINDLENYIMAELKASRIILGIIRRALEKVTHLIGQQQTSRNLRCIMLFTTLMYQVHELLDLCRATVVTEEHQTRQRSLNAIATGLRFDDYAIDAEEQSTLRQQSMLKVVRQATEVLGRLKVLAGIGPADGLSSLTGPDSAAGRARQDCYHDLEIRFQDIATKSSIGGHS